MTNAGSQLTWEEGGAGITEKRDQHGVTTDLGGGRGRNNGKTLPTRGHNRPFRCLDLKNFWSRIAWIVLMYFEKLYAEIRMNKLTGWAMEVNL